MTNWPSMLKDFRAKHKLSQKQLADKLTLDSVKSVQNWEQGVSKPKSYLELALKYLSSKC